MCNIHRVHRLVILLSILERSPNTALLGRVYIPSKCICKCQLPRPRPRLKWPNGKWVPWVSGGASRAEGRGDGGSPSLALSTATATATATVLVNCDVGGIREIANFRTWSRCRCRSWIFAPPSPSFCVVSSSFALQMHMCVCVLIYPPTAPQVHKSTLLRPGLYASCWPGQARAT